MNKHFKVLLLNMPSPPYQDVYRDAAGGFGVAFPSSRNDYGRTVRKLCIHLCLMRHPSYHKLDMISKS